jgi:hypothetical protein
VRFEERHHRLETIRVEDIISAEELDQPTAGKAQRAVPVTRLAEIAGVRIQTNPRVNQLFHQLQRPIRRCIVDDHDLQVPMRLGERGLDGAHNPARRVVGRDTDGDFGDRGQRLPPAHHNVHGRPNA